MTWLFLAVGAALVGAIALVSVGSAVRRLEDTPLPAVLEVDDAVDWIADRLPVEAAGQLSRDDVAAVVGWYLEVFAEAGLSTEHGQELGDAVFSEKRSPEKEPSETGPPETRPSEGDSPETGGRVAPLDGALEHVVARGLQQADPLDAVSVAMVADLLGTYLREMGAFGPAASGGGDASGDPTESTGPRG